LRAREVENVEMPLKCTCGSLLPAREVENAGTASKGHKNLRQALPLPVREAENVEMS
jgi:hypothetical protein